MRRSIWRLGGKVYRGAVVGGGALKLEEVAFTEPGPPEPDPAGASLHGSTFSRTVWRLYGGDKCLVMWY